MAHDTYCQINRPSCKCLTCSRDNHSSDGSKCNFACCFSKFLPCPVKECKYYTNEVDTKDDA